MNAKTNRGQWNWRERRMNRAYQVTGLDAAGETHTITVEEYTKELRNYCKECGKLGDDTFLNYCPNCGAYNGKRVQDND